MQIAKQIAFVFEKIRIRKINNMKVVTVISKVEMNLCNLLGGIKAFGLSVGFRRYFYYEVFIRYGKCRDKYIKLIYSYLEKSLAAVIEKYKNVNDGAVNSDESKNIWVCWWQGYDNMPELCKMCYENLIRNKPRDYTVHLITQNNYRQYVNIPDYIFDRMNSGFLTITQFSDILREALLYYQGGLWIDSSVWTTPDFYRFINTKSTFWSIKLDHIYKEYMIGQVISECKWTGFFMYGKRGNVVTKFAFDCMCEYFRNNEVTIDYFIQNFIIKIGYENIPLIRESIDRIPLSNSHIYDLFLRLNLPFVVDEWNVMVSDTGVFKLSQKARYKDEIDGKITFHGYIKSLHEKNMNDENWDTDVS